MPRGAKQERERAIREEFEIVLKGEFQAHRMAAAAALCVTASELATYFPVSEERWIAEKLREHEVENFVLPAGTFREPEEFLAQYQQEYVKALSRTSPHLFRELVALVPMYTAVFGVPNGEQDILDWQNKVAGFGRLARGGYKNPLRSFPFTQSSCDIPPTFRWRQYKPAFQFADLIRRITHRDPGEQLLLSSDLEIWLSEGREQSAGHIDSAYRGVGELKEAIGEYFGEGVQGQDREQIVESFLTLQNAIYEWMEKHDFERDFILDNAYLFLGQCAQHESDSTFFPKVFARVIPRRLQAEPFNFEIEGWWARDESARDYEKRVTAEFTGQVYLYLRRVSLDFRLKDLTHVTKPKDRDFESIYWLIAWNEGATKVEIADIFGRDVETIDSALPLLRSYGIPVKVGRPGRPRKSEKRLHRIGEIRQVFLDSPQKTGEDLSQKP